MEDKETNIESANMAQSTREFKSLADRSERRKRLKFFVKEYKKHMAKIASLYTITNETTEEEKEGFFKIALSHLKHSMVLKDYIKSFLPKTSDLNKLEFANKTVYYDGKEL